MSAIIWILYVLSHDVSNDGSTSFFYMLDPYFKHWGTKAELL